MARFSQAVRNMANATTLRDHKPFWLNVMIAFGLAVILLLVATLIGSLIPSPLVLLMVAAAAFLAVGLITMRIRPGATPIEPGIGAALFIVVVGIIQMMIAPESLSPLSPGQALLSVLLSGVFAFSLAYLGARLGARGGIGAPRQDASSSA